MEQTQQKPQFPTEEVTLPSKGLLYPEGHPLKSGKITMKYMTAREEDILTNQNFIKNGTVIDKLLKSLVVDKFINLDDMLIGDKNAILVAARILGYGSEYTFKAPHPETGEEEEITIDLTEADDKPFNEESFNGDNEFEFQCPHSKVLLTFKLLTQGDEKKIENEIKGLKKISKLNTANLTTRLKHMITSVNGDRDIKTVRDFVDNQFLARDSRAFRDYAKEIMPDINLKFDLQFNDGTVAEDITLPISINFFWPDASV
jgi:hypothetical protein